MHTRLRKLFSVYIEIPNRRGLESKLCTFRHYVLLDQGNGMSSSSYIRTLLFNNNSYIKVNKKIKLQS